MKYPEDFINQIIQGDCLEVMKQIPDNSIDSVVTDPPYGISFMGKKWDYDVPTVEIWKECLRVLKPGGHLLAFAGTRTQHRMAVRIEDAGFEIRDMIAWAYGSGFPKSLNIGKAVDKLQGNEREVVGKDKGHTGDREKNHEGLHDDDNYEWKGEFNITKGTSEWEGWGTALKPAIEPITLARKPLSEKSVAENVLKWGTGGINIDGCRVDLNGIPKTSGGCKGNTNPVNINLTNNPQVDNSVGRFPANLIHDGSDEVRACFPESKSSDAVRKNKVKTGLNGIYNEYKAQDSFGFNDSGNASRFFYCAKPSKRERNMGLEGFEAKRPDERTDTGKGTFTEKGVAKQSNFHPTVKPVALMRYLCRLITPPKGIVLDPFMGSGTTGMGAKAEGFEFIGIEKDPEYFKIAEARINAYEDIPNSPDDVRPDGELDLFDTRGL